MIASGAAAATTGAASRTVSYASAGTVTDGAAVAIPPVTSTLPAATMPTAPIAFIIELFMVDSPQEVIRLPGPARMCTAHRTCYTLTGIGPDLRKKVDSSRQSTQQDSRGARSTAVVMT
ncbi:hypothetical protein GCM10023353_38360 [Tomitella cavernea]|uniref:Secreted protein n=1 Tax=Tomitella cavernea TaxID=1387982 RepID=A0ABP9D392_9ACTN